MKGFLRGVLGGTILMAATTAPVWAANPGARTTGAYNNGNTPSASLADTVTTNVRANLENDRLCKGAVLTVATSPTGKVTLAGSVPNVTAKQQAIELAKGTPGVTEVDDQMRVSVSSPQGPSQD